LTPVLGVCGLFKGQAPCNKVTVLLNPTLPETQVSQQKRKESNAEQPENNPKNAPKQKQRQYTRSNTAKSERG